MKLGIISDTHGNREDMQKVYDLLAVKEKIDLFVHLGDEYDDLDSLETIPGIRLLRVPGVFGDYYQNPDIPNRLIEVIEGWKILFTHSPSVHENDPPTELSPEELVRKYGVDLVFYGHTHRPRIEKIKSAWWINPGHLKTGDKRGFPKSYATAEIKPESVEIVIYELYGKELDRRIIGK